MFYFGWIVLTLSGITVSIAAFVWAIRTGQFSDQDRARYLPLRDHHPLPEVTRPSKLSAEVCVLAAFMVIGFLSMGSTLALIFFR